MASQPDTCRNCRGRIARGNRSGYCRGCTGVAMKRALEADPIRKAALVKRLVAIARAPGRREQKRARWLAGRFWERGQAAQPAGSDARRRMAKSLSDTRLAWCPPHLRDKYRQLTKSKRLRAADARRMILEEHEAEMRRWRRSVGLDVPPAVAPPEDPDASYLARASAVAARELGVADLWAPDRDKPLVRARWAVFLALRRGGLTPPRIGRLTGRDKTTVEYGLARAEILVAGCADFAELYRKVAAA